MALLWLECDAKHSHIPRLFRIGATLALTSMLTSTYNVRACACTYMCACVHMCVLNPGAMWSLSPFPPPAFDCLQYATRRGKAWEIWSHVVLSGRQRVDSREVWIELTVWSAPPQNTHNIQTPLCHWGPANSTSSKALLPPLPDFITLNALGTAGCSWMLYLTTRQWISLFLRPTLLIIYVPTGIFFHVCMQYV